jgi:hypothetical protein
LTVGRTGRATARSVRTVNSLARLRDARAAYRATATQQKRVPAADASATRELVASSQTPHGLRHVNGSLFVRQAPRSVSVSQPCLAARCLRPLTFSDFESEPGEFCRSGESHASRLRHVVSTCIVSKRHDYARFISAMRRAQHTSASARRFCHTRGRASSNQSCVSSFRGGTSQTEETNCFGAAQLTVAPDKTPNAAPAGRAG